MRRIVLIAALVSAVMLLPSLSVRPAAACGWYGYGGCGCGGYGYSYYRPAYLYQPYYYRPVFAYRGYYGPRVWGWRGWGWRGGRRW
jgi:hypothetical protein